MGNEICIVIKTIYKLKDIKMTLWDLLFTNQKSAPPEFGLWYFSYQLPCWWLATFLSNMRSQKATSAFGTGHN